MAKAKLQQDVQAPSQLSSAISAMVGKVGNTPVLRLDVDVPTLATENGNRYPDAPAINTSAGYTLGARCAAMARMTAEDLLMCRSILEGADYETSAAFRDAWKLGAHERDGIVNVDMLWKRWVADPLKTICDWSMPKSPKSSTQRVLSAEAQAKTDKAKADKDALDAMTPAEIKAEIKAKGTTSERKATLYKALTSKEAEEHKAKDKIEKDVRKTSSKAIVDALDAMTVKEVQSVLTFCNKILASHGLK